MDLSKLSNEDLDAISKGDMGRVSNAGLQALVQGGGEAAGASRQPAPTGGGPAPAPASTPLPDVPEQYRGGKVGQQDISNNLSRQLADVPWYEKAVAGIGAAPMQAAQSVRQLLGRAPSERSVRDWRDITSTGAGAVGNIVGNIAMLAAPMGAAEKGIRAGVRFLPKAAQKLGLLTVPAVAGGESALFRPTVEGESRAEEALKSAAMGTAVSAGVRGLGRAATGLVKPSKLGQELMDQGIQPTAGEGGAGLAGGAFRFGEDLLTMMGAKPGHDLANRQAMEKIKEQITPLLEKYGDPIDLPISRKSGFFDEATDRFAAAYGSILDNKKVPLPAIFRTSTIEKAKAAVPGAKSTTYDSFEKIMGSIYSKAPGSKQTASEWKDILNAISAEQRKALKTAGTEAEAGRLGEMFAEARKALMARAVKSGKLSKGEIAALSELDNGWAKMKLVETAALENRGGTAALSGAPGERLVSIDDVISASEKTAPDVQRLNEREFFAPITRPMSEVLARRAQRGTFPRQVAYGLGSVAGLGGAALTAGATPALLLGSTVLGMGALGATEKGARVAFGNTAKQRLLAEKLRQSLYPRLGTVSAGFDTDENDED